MACAPAVDWREGLTTMAEQQSYLLENKVGSDCTFLVGEQRQEFRAHKVILLRASSVFEAMFFGAMRETGKVVITDLQADIFEHLLRFVYTDNISNAIRVGDLTALCMAADKYLMYNLREACIKKLCTKVNVDNMWSMLQVADLLKKDKLYEATMKMISDNAQTILEADDIINVSHAILCAIVQQETLNLKSELDVIDACLRWAKQECGRKDLISKDSNLRKVLGDDIISHLRFLTLSPAEFAVGPGAEDWLTSKEKSCIFVCLNTSSTFKILDGLSSNLKPRSQNVELVGAPIPCQLHTYRFDLSRKDFNITDYHSAESSDIFVKCNSDVWIKSFEVYSQINDPKIVNGHKKFRILTGSDTYLEDISISIGRPVYDEWGSLTFSHIFATFSFKGQVAYNSTISLLSDQVVKLSKYSRYTITIARNVLGYYPLCDQLSYECTLRLGIVEMVLRTERNSNKYPLHCISLLA